MEPSSTLNKKTNSEDVNESSRTGDLDPVGGTAASIGGYDAILLISVASVAILTILIRRRRR